MQIIKIERVLLFITLVSILLPLKRDFSIISVSFFEIPLLFLMVSWGIRLMRTRGGLASVAVANWDFLLISFFVWSLLATILNAGGNIAAWTVWASSFLLAFYARQNYNCSFDFRLIRNFAVTALTLELLVALTQSFTHSSIGDIRRYLGIRESLQPRLAAIGLIQRVVGLGGAPNLLGILIVILLPILCFDLMQTRNKENSLKLHFYHVMFFLSTAMMILTLSRYNLFLLGLLFLIWRLVLFLRYKNILFLQKDNIRSAAHSLLIAMFIVSSLFIFKPVRQKINDYIFGSFLRMHRLSQSANIRLEQIRIGLQSIIQKPLFGVGFNNSAYIRYEQDGVYLPLKLVAAPHNVYILIASEAGIPALFFFIILVLRPYRFYAVRFKSYNAACDGLALSVFMYLMAGHAYLVAFNYSCWPLFLFILGSFAASLQLPSPNQATLVSQKHS